MTKHKILVVDDEESLCEILQFNLEVEGYEVDTAYSAEQALGMHPERYSLILLDVMMGEMSGFKMARLLRAQPETAAVPIIFCTAAVSGCARSSRAILNPLISPIMTSSRISE